MKKFKSLASTHIRKIAILLVISTLSSTILCSCGDDKNSTQIETMIEEETTTQETSETKTEQTERQKQDADSTEDTAKKTTHQSNSTQSSTTQSTTQSTKPTTEQGHVHTWTTETYYTTEPQKVHRDAVTRVVHHDAVTHQETTYTTETQTIETAGYLCDDGAFFTDEIAANEYCYEHLLGYRSWVKSETVTVQVPHTTTVVDQAAWDETVVDKPAYDETVDVQVPHTRTVCSKCGATK